MKKYILVLVFAVCVSQTHAVNLFGGPVFCLGKDMSSMTVEVSRVNMDIESFGAKESALSQRMFLTGRYGVTQSFDLEGRVGMADLRFSDSPQSYSSYKSNYSLAWGAGIRAGFPIEASDYKLTGTLSYVGFQAKGSSTKGDKVVNSKYLWHEVSPTVTFGYKFGQLLPYCGVTKPYLFGNKDTEVSYAGNSYPNAGSKDKYTDSEQDMRGLLGIEWKLQEGYSLSAEAGATASGVWTLSMGVAQVLK